MNRLARFLVAFFFMATITPVMAQLPPVFAGKDASKVRSTSLTRKYLTAERVVWVSDPTGQFVKNAENILNPGIGQANLNG